MPLQKGTRRIKPEHTLFFDMDDKATHAVFKELPRYIQEAIAKSENFADTGLVLPQRDNNNVSDLPPDNCFDSGYSQVAGDDDLPF